MSRLLKEPIFYFLLIGCFIFLLDNLINDNEEDREDIIVTTEDRERLIAQYTQNWGEPPSQETLDKLIQEYIDSEIYYKEALKLNLDHNDEIIKRRLRQKYEFVAEDLADIVDPTTEELEAFYKDNVDRYLSPARLSFHHYYINPDKHKDVDGRASRLFDRLSSLTPERIDDRGDNGHIPTAQTQVGEKEISRVFGAAFAEEMFKQPVVGWKGIVGSGYGLHVIYIDDIEQQMTRPFEEVRDDVMVDWQTDNRALFKQELIKSVRDQYKVIRQDG